MNKFTYTYIIDHIDLPYYVMQLAVDIIWSHSLALPLRCPPVSHHTLSTSADTTLSTIPSTVATSILMLAFRAFDQHFPCILEDLSTNSSL